MLQFPQPAIVVNQDLGQDLGQNLDQDLGQDLGQYRGQDLDLGQEENKSSRDKNIKEK